MKISLWGVRGSIQTSGPDTKNVGGRTSCVLVSEGDSRIILDAGTGIQQFNTLNDPAKRIDVLLTHLHMDHIVGLGFFGPFFIPDQEVHLWGPAAGAQSLRARLSRYLSPPLFPVLLRDLPCKLTFHEIGNSKFTVDHFTIQSSYVVHPGPTVGFRVTGQKGVFTYIPDHEPAIGRNGIIRDPKWISGYDLAEEADLLYHDGQYTDEEYARRKGWGHSSVQDTLLFASLCRVKRLMLAHHDPSRSDDAIKALFDKLQLNNKPALRYEMAEEGMEIDIP